MKAKKILTRLEFERAAERYKQTVLKIATHSDILTNGDKIREMNDDELAVLLCEAKDGNCRACAYYNQSCKGKSCLAGFAEWLKLPASAKGAEES